MNPQYVEIKVAPDFIDDERYIVERIRDKTGKKPSDVLFYKLLKKSIDARKNQPFYLLRYVVSEKRIEESSATIDIPIVKYSDKKIIIVGAGPAGYFAALQCLELGIVPVVLERGKDVRHRRRDLRAIQQDGTVNPHSNYCFGEGGAGTYSDGKLYTRSHKRGKIQKVLKILYDHGAPEEIMTDAHPHIGSNKLPKIVAAIRDTIISNGGEVHFDVFVDDLLIRDRCVIGVSSIGKEFLGDAVILATGHSARDIYYLLDKKQIELAKKPFALGVRIEHPQALIDEIQYKQRPRHKNLPAASYRLACQVNGKGAFSFCMCPGGLIVPAATAPEELVVNGMSLSRRDSAFANSGLVTAIDIEEMERKGYTGLWAHLDFQKSIEKAMFQAGDGSQKAPAQRVTDFVSGRLSLSLPPTSYIPGIYAARVDELLPDFVAERLRKALLLFSKKMKGYLTSEAQMIGVESRTSSPITIPRNPQTFQHTSISGLFPCGEGAGYAGGILSAAMDGQNVAVAVGSFLSF